MGKLITALGERVCPLYQTQGVKVALSKKARADSPFTVTAEDVPGAQDSDWTGSDCGSTVPPYDHE